MITEKDLMMAPCLQRGLLAEPGRQTVNASRSWPRSRIASTFRAWLCTSLYNQGQQILFQTCDPRPLFSDLFERGAAWFQQQDIGAWNERCEQPAAQETAGIDDVETATAEHFGQLFQTFHTESFWTHPHAQLCRRLRRNNVEPTQLFSGRRVLDAGCGCGRMTFVIKALGAAEVLGVDLSPTNIELAKQRQVKTTTTAVDFHVGSVLNLPFDDESFDVVFSSGVLHHTPSWQQGLAEMMRVLKPDGSGLIMYLNETPGGLFWDLIEILRVIMSGEPPQIARNALHLIGVPPEKIIQILDPILVPINERLGPVEIEQCLRNLGAKHIRRFLRGAENDRAEQVFQKTPFAKIKYGIGENRYLFSRNLLT